MASRKEKLVTGEYYHIYNRGADKRDIFSDEEDQDRFLESMHIFNQVESTRSIRDQRENHGKAFSDAGRLRKSNDPLVEIAASCLLLNHFHILLKQKVDGGISEFMKRVLGGYTKYFNDKNDRSGVLFQGPFKSKLCNSDLYFKLIFCYVTFNFKIHNITNEKLKFVRSSWEEYVSKKFYCVDEKVSEFVLSLFGNLSKINKYAQDIVSIIRRKREKGELSEDDFKID